MANENNENHSAYWTFFLAVTFDILAFGAFVEVFSPCGVTSALVCYMVGMYIIFCVTGCGISGLFEDEKDTNTDEKGAYSVSLEAPNYDLEKIVAEVNQAGSGLSEKLDVLIQSQNLNGQMLKYIVDYIGGQAPNQPQA